MVCLELLAAIYAGAHLVIQARIPAPFRFAGVGTKARYIEALILEGPPATLADCITDGKVLKLLLAMLGMPRPAFAGVMPFFCKLPGPAQVFEMLRGPATERGFLAVFFVVLIARETFKV